MTLKSHINICTPLQPFPCKQRVGAMEPPSWKSLRKRKHDDWSFAEVQACAACMKDELPSQLRQIVEDPQYVGGTLIALINPPKVTWRDVKKNRVFIKPVVKRFQHSSPAPLLCADILLALHRMFNCKLFKIPDNLKNRMTVELMAQQEGRKLSSLVGHLRYMCRQQLRDDGQLLGTRDPDVAELKALVKKKVKTKACDEATDTQHSDVMLAAGSGEAVMADNQGWPPADLEAAAESLMANLSGHELQEALGKMDDMPSNMSPTAVTDGPPCLDFKAACSTLPPDIARTALQLLEEGMESSDVDSEATTLQLGSSQQKKEIPEEKSDAVFAAASVDEAVQYLNTLPKDEALQKLGWTSDGNKEEQKSDAVFAAASVDEAVQTLAMDEALPMTQDYIPMTQEYTIEDAVKDIGEVADTENETDSNDDPTEPTCMHICPPPDAWMKWRSSCRQRHHP